MIDYLALREYIPHDDIFKRFNNSLERSSVFRPPPTGDQTTSLMTLGLLVGSPNGGWSSTIPDGMNCVRDLSYKWI